MRLLIPGGAGYIGSHMVKYAQQHGHKVTVLDDFSTGHELALNDCEILHVNLLDKNKLSQLLNGRYFDGVIHFAAKSIVGESLKKPEFYYKNNVVGTLNLVDEMTKNKINNLVFSSTAAIFGNPITDKISENHPKNPINPYGQSKLIVENRLQDICSVSDFNVTCLRYFNAAGAHESGEIGESHEPETHLIPKVLKAALSKEINFKIFGNDYPTPDGTCIRDYVHVMDLAQAHLLALEHMKKSNGFSAFNLGNGDGFSVLNILKGCEYVTQNTIPFEIDKRRKGDPPRLVSNNKLALEALKWNPKYSDIIDIINSAWSWHSSEKF